MAVSIAVRNSRILGNSIFKQALEFLRRLTLEQPVFALPVEFQPPGVEGVVGEDELFPHFPGHAALDEGVKNAIRDGPIVDGFAGGVLCIGVR